MNFHFNKDELIKSIKKTLSFKISMHKCRQTNIVEWEGRRENKLCDFKELYSENWKIRKTFEGIPILSKELK